jgi:signal transduction histidine kinase
MPTANSLSFVQAVVRRMDPRRSLMAGTVWLVIALAVSFALGASLWVGSVARDNVLQQHERRLSLETDQLAADIGQAVNVRLDAIRAVESRSPGNAATSLAPLFDVLRSTYQELEWIALADRGGRVVASRGEPALGTEVSAAPWFKVGLRQVWLGVLTDPPAGDSAQGQPRGRAPNLGDIAAPIHDADGAVLGVVTARLRWRWSPQHLPRLTEAEDPREAAQALVLSRDGVVLVGPALWRDRPWGGTPIAATAIPRAADATVGVTVPSGGATAPQFERLADGRTVLTARAPVEIGAASAQPGWQAQLIEPSEHAYQRANALGLRILWISMGLGAATALLGALGARHLTERLKRLTQSAVAVGHNQSEHIEVPRGHDEVAQLAGAFAKVLDDLQQERRELRALSSELERRVSARTREVERLAEESRYAAIVRERLKIARDLHDTLAHSMMAMLSEIRLLRRLQTHDPDALRDELARAEEVAHAGLLEARSAIAQMRVNAVRDTGLGAALSSAVQRFADHTGIACAFHADAEAARFGDERAETLLRMAEEVLRNIGNHAMASEVQMRLSSLDDSELDMSIRDNGIGFDPDSVPPGHYGLVGLREQAQLINAQLRIDSTANRGTRIRVTLRTQPAALYLAGAHTEQGIGGAKTE